MCFSRVMHGGVSGGGGGGRDHIKDPLEVGEFVESLGVYENKTDTLSKKENVTVGLAVAKQILVMQKISLDFVFVSMRSIYTYLS